MPHKFYPDTNVIHFLRAVYSPEEFDLYAGAGGYVLCLGHQLYELARSFLYEKAQAAGRDAFAFLSQIQFIEYLPAIAKRIEAEFHLAETGMVLVTVMDTINQAATKQEILKLSHGSAKEACRFIKEREAKIVMDRERITELNRGVAKAARRVAPKRASALKTFESLQEELKPGRAGRLMQFAKRNRIKVSEGAIGRMLSSPERFPLVVTQLFAQEYLFYISASHKTAPGKDKLDDFRHLVESATCDLFVTDDGDLLTQSQKIRPFKPPMPWGDFKLVFRASRSCS